MALPEILKSNTVARSRLFSIETLDIEFSNGVRRTYERLPARSRQAVIVVGITDQQEVVLVREYLAGLHRYELGLPKGTVDGKDETFEEAANRELKEEAGYGAARIDYLREISIAPSHMGFTVHVMLARGLFPERLQGDEPEQADVVAWPLATIDDLFFSNEISEARSMAAIRIAQLHMAGEIGRA
jgi:ADP-ribose diphosphatase